MGEELENVIQGIDFREKGFINELAGIFKLHISSSTQSTIAFVPQIK